MQMIRLDSSDNSIGFFHTRSVFFSYSSWKSGQGWTMINGDENALISSDKQENNNNKSSIPNAPITAAQGFLLFITNVICNNCQNTWDDIWGFMCLSWKTIFIGIEVLKRVCLSDNRHFPKRISVMPYCFPLL